MRWQGVMTTRLCRVVAMAALLSGGAVVINEAVAQAVPAPVAVYDSVGVVPGNVASLGFEATSTSSSATGCRSGQALERSRA